MDTSKPADFGSYLEKLRKEKNLTQMELGKILDTSYTTISDMEHNKSYPTDKTLKKYSQFFEIPLEELQKKASLEREQYKIKSLILRIKKYKSEVLNIYQNSANQKELESLIIHGLSKNQDFLSEINPKKDENNTSQENLLKIPYFPSFDAFKKFKYGKKDGLRYISKYVESNKYSNPENIIAIKLTKKSTSMNRLFTENGIILVELTSKVDPNDIILYSYQEEKENKIDYNIARFNISDDFIFLVFESFDFKYRQCKLIDNNNISSIEILGKVIDFYLDPANFNLKSTL